MNAYIYMSLYLVISAEMQYGPIVGTEEGEGKGRVQEAGGEGWGDHAGVGAVRG
jgi:hypothetical protein